MFLTTAPLPCGRSRIPAIQRLHRLDATDDLGIVVNNLTGAWMGGRRGDIRAIFDHLATGEPSLTQLPPGAQDEIRAGEIGRMTLEPPEFRPHLAVIHVGHVCNIDCSYCYAPKDHLAMSDEVMQKVTDFLAGLHHPLFVQFMGGEPLIYRTQISRLVELLNDKRAGLETTYGLQTNGLFLVDPDVITFLQERKIRFGISYDGPGEMSLARFGHRLPQLLAKTEQVIDDLLARGHKFGILAVLNRSNAGRLPELLEWCLARGITSLLVNPLLSGQGKTDAHSLLPEEATASMRELFRYWVDRKLYRKIELEGFQAFEDNVAALSRPYMCRKQRCGAGREQLAFDTEGNIFPCDYLVGESEFELGNVQNLLPLSIRDSKRMKALHEEVHPDRLSECSSCPMFAFCGSCMASSHFHNGTLNGRRGSCHTDYAVIQDIVFEMLCNEDYREHILHR